LPAPAPAATAAASALASAATGGVSLKASDRLAYSRDMWTKALLWVRQGRVPPPPDAVVWPSDEAEVAAVIRACRSHHLAVIPFGAGSGVCGGVLAVQGGVALDLKRLERVATVDAERRCVDAQAGVLGEVLERTLNRQGWTLGHFPSSIYMSTLGGWLAARSAGQLSGKYGKIEDMVLSVRAVTGAGELIETPDRPRRGPDLAHLLIGSEGTLCAFTGARLRVHPLPAHRAFRGYTFKTLQDGVEAMRRMFRAGLRPAALRLYDPLDTAVVVRGKASRVDGGRRPKPGWRADLFQRLTLEVLSRPTLFNGAGKWMRECRLITLSEGEAVRTTAEDEAARSICLGLGARDLGEGPGQAWFRERYAVSYKMSKIIESGAFADTMEVAATWDKVIGVYEAVRAACSPLAFVLCHLSHAYPEGCSLYFSFVGAAHGEEASELRYDALWATALGAAQGAGATVSHHHGIGVLKTSALQKELGDGWRLLRALKRALDPDGIMNPGKLSDAMDLPTPTAAPTAPPAPAADGVAWVDERSGTAAVDARVGLEQAERRLNDLGLSLGPLSPGALGCTVREFVEGPYAGLRAVRGGRLEPATLCLQARLPDGALYRSHASPRRAAGPELDALFLGGEGQRGALEQAVFRLFSRPPLVRDVAYGFGDGVSCIRALRQCVASGAWIGGARIEPRGARLSLGLRILGDPGGVARDAASVAAAVVALGGKPEEFGAWTDLSPVERELSWDDVQQDAARSCLALYRLSLESVVARGSDRGTPIAAGGWPAPVASVMASMEGP